MGTTRTHRYNGDTGPDFNTDKDIGWDYVTEQDLADSNQRLKELIRAARKDIQEDK